MKTTKAQYNDGAVSGVGRRGWLMRALGISLVVLTGCERAKTSFVGIDLTGAAYGRDFRLQDSSGATRTLADFKGKLVMLFFGFTHCPDVCPTALARAVEVRRLLGPEGNKVQVILVTVDPERDTGDVLRNYVAAFDPSFLALRGDTEATRATAAEFKVFYQKVPTASSYTMDHTASTYVIDPHGRLRLALRHDQSAPDVAADLRALLKEAT